MAWPASLGGPGKDAREGPSPGEGLGGESISGGPGAGKGLEAEETAGKFLLQARGPSGDDGGGMGGELGGKGALPGP